MKTMIGLVIMLLSLNVMGQTDSSKVNDSLQMKAPLVKDNPTFTSNLGGYDKVRLVSGDSLIVSIQAETQTEIGFKYPLNTILNQLPVSKIKEIVYRDGKTKSFVNKPLMAGVGAEPDNLWRTVVVTSNESDVAGLKELGPVTSRSEGKTPKTKIEILEKNATVFIQKKALKLGATKVLIKDKNVEQSYGEIPYVELQGIAYGPN